MALHIATQGPLIHLQATGRLGVGGDAGVYAGGVDVALLQPLLQDRQVVLQPVPHLLRGRQFLGQVRRRLLGEFGAAPELAPFITLRLHLGPELPGEQLHPVGAQGGLDSLQMLPEVADLLREPAQGVDLRGEIDGARLRPLHLVRHLPDLRPVLPALFRGVGTLRLDLAQLAFQPLEHALQRLGLVGRGRHGAGPPMRIRLPISSTDCNVSAVSRKRSTSDSFAVWVVITSSAVRATASVSTCRSEAMLI